MSAWYRFEPLANQWPDPTPAHERRTRYTFKASWSNTLELLAREIRLLDPNRPWEATDAIMSVACGAGDINKDGTLSARSRPWHPGVKITFNTAKHGQLTYATDVCEFWQHNVRSIALGLESLRAINRFGVSKRGQQYTGFKALNAGRAMPASHMTSDVACAVLAEYIGNDPAIAVTMRNDLEMVREAYRHARRRAHPDHNGGDRTAWDQVEQAAAVLGLLS